MDEEESRAEDQYPDASGHGVDGARVWGARAYLGDSVYVEVEHGMLELTTENGIRATNTVYLEDEVLYALVEYVRTLTR